MTKPSEQHSSTESGGATPRPTGRSLRWWLSRLGNVGLFLGAGILLIVLLGVAQRVGWIQSGSLATPTRSGAGADDIHTCPMHPQIRQPGPGRCPICGMALVPAATKETDVDQLAVTIEPAQRRLANIQTAMVTQQPVTTTIRTIGSIEIDESRQATIASYIDGRVERIFADYTGVEVEQGDHLAVVYSPQLYSAQVEYIEARRALNERNSSTLASVQKAQTNLVANARQRLIELGMTAEQLETLDSTRQAQSRLTIHAAIGGTVTEKLVEEGQYISAGEPIYRIANLSTVWLMLEFYPEDASLIRYGQQVRAELTSHPGQNFSGRVAFIAPNVDKDTRTVGVRVEFDNADGELRPGDYAQAMIEIPIGPQGDVYDAELAGKWISPMHPQVIRDQPGDCPICGMKLVPTSRFGYTDQPVAQPTSITVPRSALLMAGDHSVVYVETEPGRFELRDVTLGAMLRDNAIVVDGLKPGEEVATSGNFLIDSQMQLAGKPSLIDPTRYVAESHSRPLTFDSIAIVRIQGTVGEDLEQLYSHYFTIQQALSRDELPTDHSVAALSHLSAKLAKVDSLEEDVQKQLSKITTNASRLHHLSLNKARAQFKRMSHAVTTLATKVRGQGADRPFYHFFCPMVEQGQGDWLQAEDQIANPYFGSNMFRCGELVEKIPPNTTDEVSPVESSNEHGADRPPHRGDN